MSTISPKALDVNCSDRQEIFQTVMTVAMDRAAEAAQMTINTVLDAEATEALGRAHR